MAYVGIDVQGARALGEVLRDAAGRTEQTRRQAVAALGLADLTGQAPAHLALVQDGLTTLGDGVSEKAELADRFTVQPQQTAGALGATPAELSTAIAGLLGFTGPRTLRDVLAGLPPPGADGLLDAALARLSPMLLGPVLAGAQPQLPEPPPAEVVADLRLLALRLGIEQVGPPAAEAAEPSAGGFLGLIRQFIAKQSDTEVFYHDFWSDGRTVAEVLADPAQLLAWVSGTVELDRRLALAAGLPSLGDALASYDFARGTSDGATETDFAGIADYLPALLAGRTTTGPNANQLTQTLAFATRVGWIDPATGSDADRFAAAVAYLRANRILQSALLPTGFAGDQAPLAFFNAPGIAVTLELGRSTGVLDQSYLTGLAALLDRLAPAIGLNLTGPPGELTEGIQQQLFALVASQIPRAMADSPVIQGQFVAALGHLRQAATGPELRQRILDVVAAFRTIAVVGAPALTERQLTSIVGDQVLGVLGRGRLRLRSASAVQHNPEFLLVARQWGIPGSRKEEIGKYKFTFGFDELGVLTGIRRKKKSWLSRAWDSVKAVGKAILESWKDNPFKAIFQVGKIALGALSLVVPGLQVIGAASLALNLAEAAYNAIEGDWLAALGSGLSAFTAGADIFGTAAKTAVDALQGDVLTGLFDPGTLDVLRNAKRAFDIGTSVLRFTQADGLLGSITGGLGAAATALGSGGQLLGGIGAIDKQLADDLVRLGATVLDVNRVAAPATGLLDAIRRGDLLGAFGSGLSALSAGALAVANPKGVLGGPPGTSVFEFDAAARADLVTLARGAGVAASLARAINAADAGNAFQAGAALADAVRLVNGPRRPGDPQDEFLGDPAEVTKRVAELGAVLEAVFKGASPVAAAPVALRQLGRVVDALNPAPTKAKPADAAPASVPGSAVDTNPPVVAVSAASTFSAEAETQTVFGAQTLAATGARIEFPDGAGTIQAEEGFFLVPPGAKVILPDGTVHEGGDRAPGGALDLPVPGMPEPIPGRYLDEPQLPGLELFFPRDGQDIPMSGNDQFDGVRFAAASTTLSDAGGSLVGGNPTVRGTPMPFVWLPQPETQLNPPVDWSGLATPAFTPNAIMEGGSRTVEGLAIVAGGGTSVEGPWKASHSIYGGVELGAQLVDNDGAPVDGLTLTGNIGAGFQIGRYGFNAQVNSDVNIAPVLDGNLPVITNDTIVGVVLPYIGAVGFRATGDQIRWLEQDDFAYAWGGGLSLMGGVKFPVTGQWALERIAGMAGLTPEEVQLVRDAPDGTRLAYDVSDEFREPFQPPFGTTLDFGEPYPAEPGLGGSGAVDVPDPSGGLGGLDFGGGGGDFGGGGGDFGGGGATAEIPLVPDGIVLDYGGGAESFGLDDLNVGSSFDDDNLADYGFQNHDFGAYDFDENAVADFGDYGAADGGVSDYGITDYGFENYDVGSYEFSDL